MLTSHLLSCGLAGTLVAWMAIRLIRTRAVPGGAGEGGYARQFHHSHQHFVPRLGGIAFAAAFLAVAFCAVVFLKFEPLRNQPEMTFVLGSLAMFAVGLYDDLRPLGAKRKLLLQVLIAVAVYAGGLQIQTFKNPLTGVDSALGGWGVPATVVWLVGLTNLINLIDGIDGLAGGIGLMLMGLLAYVSLHGADFVFLLAVGMAGSLLAFLYFNFPPAKIYMGDGGAYLVGFLIGGMTILSSHKGTVVAALLALIFALGLPIIDTALAIARRGLQGLPLFRPDRKHIHHRLVDSGFSRRRAVLTLYALSLLFLLMAFGIFWSQGRLVPVLFGVMFLALAISARSFGFIQDWLAVGKVVGNSLEMRKQTRYALALATWFELEAERCRSTAELWENFQFLVRKLGFTHARLVLEDGEQTWQANGVPFHLARQEGSLYELHSRKPMTLEFIAQPDALPGLLFSHMTELAAESWFKGAQRWQMTNQLPVRFQSAIASGKHGDPYSVAGNP
jgi:UDP-GlcNAc:undecaprenyl-phosphate GlcNAc-1-phosphate transferase